MGTRDDVRVHDRLLNAHPLLNNRRRVGCHILNGSKISMQETDRIGQNGAGDANKLRSMCR